MNRSTTSAAKWVFFILLVLIALAFGFERAVSQWGDSICPRLAGLCNNIPFVFGALVLLLLWACYRFLSGLWNPLEIVRGVDKRWSTSKFQFFLWTIVALLCYSSFFAKRIGAGVLNPSSFAVPQNLLLAMGLSVTTALAAKGITTSQINRGDISKEHVGSDEAQTSDLISDDGGTIDLTKVQLLGWTVIAIGAYLASVVHTIRHVTAASKMPDIDLALMVLMGLGQGAYVAKKMIFNSSPLITNVDPPKPRPGREVKLTGTSFGTTQGNGDIAINGVIPTPHVSIKSWGDTSIIFILPGPPLPAGWSAGQQAVSVVIDDGTDSNSMRFELLPRGPLIAAISSAGGALTLGGSDFGSSPGLVKINDKPAQVSNWTDTAISLANPDPANVKSGATVSAKVWLSDDPINPATVLAQCNVS